MQMKDTRSDLFRAVGQGILTFPVTHFGDDYSFDEDRYRDHIEWLLGFRPAILFAAGGTGEFFSLDPDEYERVVRVAVDQSANRVPVIAGCGYGTALALKYAAAAERAGAAALLLLPHYLVSAEQAGLEAHVSGICRATNLGVIVYNRDNCVLGPDALARLCERHPNLIGFKDGVGDIELVTRIRNRLGDRVFYVGGLPTHETFAAPYRAAGIANYSSAIFNFLPGFATSFYRAVQAGDAAFVNRALGQFVLPYVEIRNRRRGYAVSIVKAGLKCIGRSPGPVRPPLVDLAEGDLRDLRPLIRLAEKEYQGRPSAIWSSSN
jgi:5-dehydro-4-deoxyglucarate dehydratase